MFHNHYWNGDICTHCGFVKSELINHLFPVFHPKVGDIGTVTWCDGAVRHYRITEIDEHGVIQDVEETSDPSQTPAPDAG